MSNYFRYLVVVLGCILGISANIFAANFRHADLAQSARKSNVAVKRVTAKGVPLSNDGFVEALAAFSGYVGNGKEHWWLEIETVTSDIWYILQIGWPRSDKVKYLEFSKSRSSALVDEKGAPRRSGDDPKIFKVSSFKPSNLTIGDIYRWALKHDCKNLSGSNNGQDLVTQLFVDFNGQFVRDHEKSILEEVSERVDYVDTAASVRECNIQ